MPLPDQSCLRSLLTLHGIPSLHSGRGQYSSSVSPQLRKCFPQMQSAGERPQTLHGQDTLHSCSPTTVDRCCVTPHITLGGPRSSLTGLHLIPPCAASAWTWCSREGAATPYVPMCGRGQCPTKGCQNSFFSGSGTASVGCGLHAKRECPPPPCHIQLACLSQKGLEKFPISSYTTALTPNILRQLSSPGSLPGTS